MKRFRLFLTKEQKTKVGEDIKTIEDRVESLRSEINGEASDRAHKDNEKCPNCGNRDPKKIVNKISRVQGHGEVSGSLFGIYGSSDTDTNEVNHCNDCGNQWKKVRVDWKWQSDIFEDCLRSLNTKIEKRGEMFWSYDVKRCKVFEGMCVESILDWDKKHGSNWRTALVTKKNLKSYYKSVKGG